MSFVISISVLRAPSLLNYPVGPYIGAPLYSMVTVLHHPALYYTSLYYTEVYSAALYSSELYCTVLYSTALQEQDK